MSDEKPDYKKSKQAALDILKKYGIKEPPVNPILIAEELGANVIFATFSGDIQDVSGYYDPEEDKIFINQKEFPKRQVFTIAHELGHRQLHMDWAKSNEYQPLYRDDTSEKNYIEKEANCFAAHLLVPRFMMDDFYSIATREQLSDLFVVSLPVINNRLGFEYGIYQK